MNLLAHCLLNKSNVKKYFPNFNGGFQFVIVVLFSKYLLPKFT